MPVIDLTNDEYVDSGSPIPNKTIVKVQLNIKQGSCNQLDDGTRLDFYATKSTNTGAVYLDCEYTVVEGEYYKRKIFDMIGLYSPNNGNKWADMGRSLLKGILSSARRVSPKDKSPQAQKAFILNNYQELEGLVFLVEVKVEEQGNYDPRNKIAKIITPDHKDYHRLMGDTHNPYGHSSSPQYQQPQGSYSNAFDNTLNDDVSF
ncbi:hypothetical protein [Candidatus Liberibacter asiaticus]|uniref:hypothetical protein n=1 Tax=Liberibacter asiaticus TaxID=34021 RepID=UPI00405A1850